MDPPLCGSTSMSHNEFTISEPIEPQEASPMKHEMHDRVWGVSSSGTDFHAKAWRRNNVPLHFGLHSCSGFSTLFSQYHPLPAEVGCLRSKHGVFLSEDLQSRHRTAFASIRPEPVRK